jgi:hypothetical protein
VKLEWQLFQIVFEGRLSDDGNRLAGTWKQNGKALTASFERRERPATVLPENLSFTPEKPDDIRGQWQGTLEVPGNKLRIVLKIGKTPDGIVAGTLASPDQGSGDIPMSAASVTNQTVKLEWQSLHGVYKGTMNREGTLLDGTWEQMGPPLKLKLERVRAVEETSLR